MSAGRAVYLDSSVIVKLTVAERVGHTSALAAPAAATRLEHPVRTEVARAPALLREQAVRRRQDVLAGLELLRISDHILAVAGRYSAELRMLDAIHLAAAIELGSDLGRIVTYDARMSAPRVGRQPIRSASPMRMPSGPRT